MYTSAIRYTLKEHAFWMLGIVTFSKRAIFIIDLAQFIVSNCCPTSVFSALITGLSNNIFYALSYYVYAFSNTSKGFCLNIYGL